MKPPTPLVLSPGLWPWPTAGWPARGVPAQKLTRTPSSSAPIKLPVLAGLRRSPGGMSPSRSIIDELLANLSLDGCAALSAAIDSAPELNRPLDSFVDSVARHVDANPHLCSVVGAISARVGDRPMLGEDDDTEIRRIVHYALLLHVITAAVADDAVLAAQVFGVLRRTVLSTPRWWERLSLFERSKVATIELTLRRFDEHRAEGSIPAGFGRLGLPVNIAEAVVQDVASGYSSNAAAGALLAAARPGERRGASVSADGRRAIRMHMPLDSAWQKLYISWNMCFTNQYADSPYFAAALLAPAVSGAPADEFVFRRTFALTLHLAMQILSRSGTDSATHVSARVPRGSAIGPVQGVRDWRDPGLSAEWGEINLAAAQRYTRLRLLARRRGARTPLAAGGLPPALPAWCRARWLRRAMRVYPLPFIGASSWHQQ